MGEGPKKQKIRGAKHTKGRTLSGHADALEHRTFQESAHLESVDRVMRKWRAEPPMGEGPRPEVSHLVSRLREAVSREVDTDLLDPATSQTQRRPRPEPKAAKGSEKVTERAFGGWIYTIRWPEGEIIDKRREV